MCLTDKYENQQKDINYTENSLIGVSKFDTSLNAIYLLLAQNKGVNKKWPSANILISCTHF